MMYLSNEYIAYLPFLQALAAFGEADERDKRDNSYDNDNQIKHAVPPRWTLDSLRPVYLYSHFCGLPPPPPGARAPRSETAWAGTPGDEIPPTGPRSPVPLRGQPPAVCGLPPRVEGIPRAEQRAAPPSLSDRAG